MLWVGTEQEIGLLEVLCDEAVTSTPEVKADGSAVPESERVTTRWAEPQTCSTCDVWSLPVHSDVTSMLPQVTLEQWRTEHAHVPTVPEQRGAVAALLPGLTPQVADAVSDASVSSVYNDLVQAGIISDDGE